jgi:scyllo-inositol 2-dehydrogenase (NADP+)
MSDGRIRVGVMGQGRSGYNIHVRCMKDVESVARKFVVVAVADQLDVRRQQAAEELGCEVYDDWRKMLDAGGFDMVVNSLPSPLHVDATIQAFKQGYHVLSEKPLAKKVWAAHHPTPDCTRAVPPAAETDRTAPTWLCFAGRRRRPHS